jgi:hypothetical protein
VQTVIANRARCHLTLEYTANMHLQHLRVHRRADGLFGFGNIAHEIDVSADASKRDVEKRNLKQ